MKKISAIVVGLGNVGLHYDYNQSDDKRVATHSSGIFHHPAFDLIGGVDPDRSSREMFTKKYAAPAFANITEALQNLSPQVVSIAVPTALHLEAVRESMQCKPAALICEKPIALKMKDAQEILALTKAAKCSLLVNYMRRFEPGIFQLRSLLAAGEVGDPYKAVAWYTKGFRHNGSHFVDLFRFLFGEAEDIVVLQKGRTRGDADMELDARISFGGVTCYFLAAKEEYFPVAQAEVLCTNGVVRYLSGGKNIELEYGGTPELQRIPSDLPRYQWHVMDALYRHLSTGEPLVSTGESALETLAVVERALKLART